MFGLPISVFRQHCSVYEPRKPRLLPEEEISCISGAINPKHRENKDLLSAEPESLAGYVKKPDACLATGPDSLAVLRLRRVTLDTIRTIHEHEHQLAAYCSVCERWAVLDLERLIA